MTETVKTISKNSTIIVGYDSSFLSFAIVILSGFSMLVKFNRMDISTLNICDFDFLLATATILLTAADIFFSYWRFGKNRAVFLIKILSGIALVLSGVIIISAICVHAGIFVVIDNAAPIIDQIGWNGNLKFFHTVLGFPYWSPACYLKVFGLAIFFQFVANICKKVLNKKISSNKI